MNTDELIERISIALQEMSGFELAKFATREFGINVHYLGDDEFEEALENVDNIPSNVSVNWKRVSEPLTTQDFGSCFNMSTSSANCPKGEK